MSGGKMYVVRQDKLAETPEGFQRYVADHFKERTLVGVPVLYASIRCWDHTDYENWRRGGMRGIAPHPHLTDKYDLGRGLGKRLVDWIESHHDIVETVSVVGEEEGFIDDD
jgi:hypothetical protein